MATTFELMTGHAVMLARDYVQRGEPVHWAKVTAWAIHARRSVFGSATAYLQLSRDLELAAKRRLRQERKAPKGGRILAPAQHYEIGPRVLRPARRGDDGRTGPTGMDHLPRPMAPAPAPAPEPTLRQVRADMLELERANRRKQKLARMRRILSSRPDWRVTAAR